jgi:tetratricopeptide (TPR) repeat protein
MWQLFLNHHRMRATPPSRAARAGLVLCAMLAVGSTAKAEGTKRHFIDESDFVRLGTEQQHARALLEQGEAALARGDAPSAIPLFEQGTDEAPHSALLARRLCQALMEIGERDRALQACRRAMQRQASPLDVRALVRVLVSGPNAPNFDELHEATLLTTRAEKSMPRQPWAYAASCDIARRLGDAAMLDACRKSLQRVAPDHAETRRALASLRSTPSVVAVTAGWAALALAVVATLIDRMRRPNRRAGSSPLDTSPRAERAKA